ncbi:protein yellow-like [Culicoides brevitarsis]|uniref:protein yellow-like n=1 Tax=Culicoides brevitarsis TaxID=469753 RepID=UPI00307B9873
MITRSTVLLVLAGFLIKCSYGQYHESAHPTTQLGLITQWNEMQFVFPTTDHRQIAIYQGKYMKGASTPLDIDLDYSDTGRSRLFVTIPRFGEGVPITLGVVSTSFATNESVLHAYPSYAWQESHGANCDGITSVFRVAIDECGRLFVLDTGRIGDQQYCPPQLLIFNLRNDKLIHRYKFPYSVLQDTSILVTPIVNVHDPPPGKCRDTQVYIADVTTYHVIVYDMRTRRSWRTANKLFYPHPTWGTFVIAGETFDLMDGIVGMALSPKNTIGGQQMFFHPMASTNEMTVPLWVLNNRTAWENAGYFDYYEPRSFVEIGDRGTQSAAQAMDRYGNMYFGLMDPIAIACWNINTPYDKFHIRLVSQNDETLQFASGVKIITNRLGEEELWVITNRIQKVLTETISDAEVNFRILAIPTNQLLDHNKRCIGPSLEQKFIPLANF